ncbi:unnamed protein product [Caenorhabditis angaria]|uniref:AMP-dependent synthetase/ligase domain-containing protein n=1 Tax=Caenorhabditis angaria TaxID=860376 RepID=A0A9P1NB48_9PELO|nr:unnamed protein product [Caenorhabditis angaria]
MKIVKMSDYYPSVLFHNLILENINKFENRIALVDGEKIVYFNEIPKLAESLENTIDLEKGDVILVCLPNSIWFPLLFLAAAKLGVVMSGISSESTETEIQYFIQESGAKMLYTDQKTSDRLSDVGIPIYVLQEFDNNFSVNPSKNESGNNSEIITIDDVLLAPFSSGTTGSPKCCFLTHRNFLASTYSLKQAVFDDLLKESNKKTLAFLPFYHASGFWALLLCLLEGCTIYIMNEFHPMKMMDMIEKYEIDTINIVPVIANVFLKIGFIGGRCRSLRTILCGSSGLSKERCRRLLSMFPQVTNFLQGYGMTEIVVLSNLTPLNDNFEHLGSCGKLLPGFEAKLSGFDGELFLRSDAIMKTYKNGSPNIDADGWMKSGDIVEISDNGFFNIVDRKKDMIKVNGFQVSPTEIENVILSLSKVVEVAVVGIEDELSGQLPKAFIVLEEGSEELLFIKQLEHVLREKLSAIKQLRGGISFLKNLPKSASGKVQKNRLLEQLL